MAKFETMPRAKAPRKDAAQAARFEYEEFVGNIPDGEVGKIDLDEGENARGIVLRVSAAGKRLGRTTNCWYGEGCVYVRVD